MRKPAMATVISIRIDGDVSVITTKRGIIDGVVERVRSGALETARV